MQTRNKVLLSLTFAFLALSCAYYKRDTIITHYFDYQQAKNRRPTDIYQQYYLNGNLYYMTGIIRDPEYDASDINPAWVLGFTVTTTPGLADEHVLTDVFRGFAGPRRDFHREYNVRAPTIEDVLLQGSVSYHSTTPVNVSFHYMNRGEIISVVGSYLVTTELASLIRE